MRKNVEVTFDIDEIKAIIIKHLGLTHEARISFKSGTPGDCDYLDTEITEVIVKYRENGTI